MWRHCSPRVKTSQALLPEAKPRAIMLLRSSPEGYSDVAEGNIFFLLPATPCSIRFITWQNHVFRWFADLPSVYVLFIPIYAQHWCFCLRRLAYLVLLPAAHTLSSDHLMTLLNTCWTKQEFLICWRFITQHIDALCQPHQTVISSSITSRQSCLSWIYSYMLGSQAASPPMSSSLPMRCLRIWRFRF